MSASVTVDHTALGDTRFDHLAELAGFNRHEALGRMVRLWAMCVAMQTDRPPIDRIRNVLGAAATAALAESNLAEAMPDGTLRVRGLVGRMEWFGALPSQQKKAGKARMQNAERDSKGRVLPKTEVHVVAPSPVQRPPSASSALGPAHSSALDYQDAPCAVVVETAGRALDAAGRSLEPAPPALSSSVQPQRESQPSGSGPRATPVSGSSPSPPVSGASGIAAAVPGLGLVEPDPEHGLRSALLNDSWLHLNARRRELAEEFGLEAPPRGWGISLNATGYAELAKRIRESPSLASARVDIAHVFAVAEANVRAGDPVSLEYFTGAMFEKKSWDKKLTMTIADASRASRRGPLPAGKSAFDVIADLGNELRALAPE